MLNKLLTEFNLQPTGVNKCYISHLEHRFIVGEKNTIQSDHTVLWITGLRHQRRNCSVRLLKRSEAAEQNSPVIQMDTNSYDWCHSWGRVNLYRFSYNNSGPLAERNQRKIKL